jgi:hypothetical protein
MVEKCRRVDHTLQCKERVEAPDRGVKVSGSSPSVPSPAGGVLVSDTPCCLGRSIELPSVSMPRSFSVAGASLAQPCESGCVWPRVWQRYEPAL